MYLELVLKEDNEPGEEFRRKFRQHILRSQKVQFAYLLSRLESSTATGKNLHYEKAILYGKVMLLRPLPTTSWIVVVRTEFCITICYGFSDDGTRKSSTYICLQPKRYQSSREVLRRNDFKSYRRKGKGTIVATLPDSALNKVTPPKNWCWHSHKLSKSKYL